MGKAKAIITVCFLSAFVAGLVIGMESRQKGALPPPPRPGGHGGWLTSALGLTPEQQEQMRQIWSDTVGRGGPGRDDRRRQLFRERDEAIAALIRPEDKPRYDEILKKHAEQMSAMEREWHRSFEAAVERTKEILTPEQRAKYEKLLQRHGPGGPPHERHGDRERERGRPHDGKREPGQRGEYGTTTRGGEDA